MSRVTLIVAVARNGVIGKDGGLPWRIPADLKRFKALTLGKPIIMGRKTWDSLPTKPLPGRANIVVTRNLDFRADGAATAHSFEQALAEAAKHNANEVMIIGGEAIFESALPLADRIELTEVSAAPDGDASMPQINRSEWREIAREGPFDANGVSYSFVTLERR